MYRVVVLSILQQRKNYSNSKGEKKMKIKHFSGYGIVNAKKISKTENDKQVLLIVKITGDHEQGLTRSFHDPYLIANWIVKKFEKNEFDYLSVNYDCLSGYENGLNEYAVYTITYETK